MGAGVAWSCGAVRCLCRATTCCPAMCGASAVAHARKFNGEGVHRVMNLFLVLQPLNSDTAVGLRPLGVVASRSMGVGDHMCLLDAHSLGMWLRHRAPSAMVEIWRSAMWSRGRDGRHTLDAHLARYPTPPSHMCSLVSSLSPRFLCLSRRYGGRQSSFHRLHDQMICYL
jgi:hypothetical protein